MNLPHLGPTEEFAQALGVTIRYVTTDAGCTTDDCARYDKYNRIAYFCDSMCSGRDVIAVDALFARIT